MVECSFTNSVVLGLSPVVVTYVFYLQTHNLQNSGAKYVGNKMPRQIQNFSICLDNASAKKTAKGLAETCVYNAGNDLGVSQHFAKGYDFF